MALRTTAFLYEEINWLNTKRTVYLATDTKDRGLHSPFSLVLSLAILLEDLHTLVSLQPNFAHLQERRQTMYTVGLGMHVWICDVWISKYNSVTDPGWCLVCLGITVTPFQVPSKDHA